MSTPHGMTVNRFQPQPNGRPWVHPLPAWKRVADVVGASAGLLVLSPLFVLVAGLIKLSSRGPVFFRQQRFGLRGRPFRVWKFRTMHVDANATEHAAHVRDLVRSPGAPLRKIDARDRLIPFGKWLRRSAIDELPQLVNVLAGQMSLIGPRPDVLPPEEYEPWQRARFDVPPGMSGLWQVRGKNNTTFHEMIRLDVAYIRNRSPWLDLRILLGTGPAIVRELLASRRGDARGARNTPETSKGMTP